MSRENVPNTIEWRCPFAGQEKRRNVVEESRDTTKSARFLNSQWDYSLGIRSRRGLAPGKFCATEKSVCNGLPISSSGSANLCGVEPRLKVRVCRNGHPTRDCDLYMRQQQRVVKQLYIADASLQRGRSS